MKTPAQRAAIARRPKIRRTARTIGAAFAYYDKPRRRWVIYRTAGGVTRKTSIRGAATDADCYQAACRAAERIARWPADKLATFEF